MISIKKLTQALTHEGLTKTEDNETLVAFTTGNLRLSLLKKNKYDNKFEVHFKQDRFMPKSKQVTYGSSLCIALAKMLMNIGIEQVSMPSTDERVRDLYDKSMIVKRLLKVLDPAA